MSHHRINYIEFAAYDLAEIERFYSAAFAWHFTAYGPDYIGFSDHADSTSEQGGFYRVERNQGLSQTQNGAALVILLSHDLEASLATVEKHGGQISKAIFSFPGGRRFHFNDPSGNELAVWSMS
jgi:uncharacterized protein